MPYRTMIRHTRTQAVRHDFRYRHVMWLVDLAAVPDPPRPFRRWLPQFAARDHLGDPGASIRENVDRFLADHGIDLSGGRVLMLTNPRTMGYVFNPITVYWCHEPDDSVRAVIAEVHNTFGDRHCYLVEPDATGRAETEKQMYVSPFFPVDGRYAMRFGPPGERVDVSITLRRDDPPAPALTATLTGRRGRTPRSFTVAALRRPGSSLRVIALIHWQALQLWLRRLPLVPRPAAPSPTHTPSTPSTEPTR